MKYYVVINSNEIQYIHSVTTYHDLKKVYSQCSNKQDLFKHLNERVQIVKILFLLLNVCQMIE